MSEKKSIYHEAVADAKTLKATALANAKMAIEETFTPSLQKLINEKLTESEESESSEEMKKEVSYGSAEDKDTKPVDEKKKSSEEKSSEEKSSESDLDETLDLDELLRELEAEDKGEYVDYSKEEHPDSQEYEAKFASAEDKNTKPLDEKGKSSEEKSSESDLEEKRKSSEEKSSESDLEEKKKSKGSEADKAPSKEDADQYEMYLELKKKFEPAASSDADKVEIDELDGINIEELIAELEKSSEEEMKASEECEEAKYASSEEKSTKPMDENDKLKREIATIKAELNEAVLINAKAISFSRLTKDNDNLTREDKVKILKQIDKAKTVAETKLIFDTIKESFEIGKQKTKSKESIKESLGFVNKPINAPKTEESNIVDDPIKARWQMLAGITKKRTY